MKISRHRLRSPRDRLLRLAALITLTSLTILWPAPLKPQLAASQTESVYDRSYFFRLTAKYMHGDEAVDFDIVVGCNVRVTVYGDNSSSFDAFRDPVFYVKRTQDGGAVLQLVPNACEGETTQNGKVPSDLLPGAIWFENAGDFTLGISYVTEDAFDNPKAALKFLGATIREASRHEWEAFRPIAAQNLLSTRPFSRPSEAVPAKEVKANLWNKAKLAEWRPVFRCYGVARYRLADGEIRNGLRLYWPTTRPRFWTPADPGLTELRQRLTSPSVRQRLLADGRAFSDYFRGYEWKGFPTRSRGGTLYSGHPWSPLPRSIYPVRADDAVPWLTPALSTAETIYRDVELGNGSNVGFTYCYTWFRKLSKDIVLPHLPDYFRRRFVTRVDGQPIQYDDPDRWGPDVPFLFFENDEYFYLPVQFGLN